MRVTRTFFELPADLGIKGPMLPFELSPTVMPTYLIGSLPGAAGLQVQIQDRWLSAIEEGTAYGAGATVAGAAGFLSKLQLFNPVGSGLRFFLKAAWFTRVAAGIVRFMRHNVALGAASGFTDNLLLGNPDTAAGNFRTSNAEGSVGNLITDFQCRAAITEVLPVDWLSVIPAGFGLHLESATVNEQLQGGFLWAEVPA